MRDALVECRVDVGMGFVRDGLGSDGTTGLEDTGYGMDWIGSDGLMMRAWLRCAAWRL
jgi:hypothetical protein